MADFVSHHLFGEQTLTAFPASVQQIVARHRGAFLWGCQGPDPFFYRKLALGGPLHRFGTMMHSQETDELFFTFCRAVHTLTGDAHNAAAAYFFGFLCHYALDSEIHPFVYFCQEQLRSAHPKWSASAVHCQIESDIDFLLYTRFYGHPVSGFSFQEYRALPAHDKAVLAVLLHTVLRQVYRETVTTREIRRAFDDMLCWETKLYQENRPVYRICFRLEQLLGRGPLLSGHMKIGAPLWDALNQSHQPWHNLWRPEEIRTESVPELFVQARIRAAGLAGQYAAQFDTGCLLRMHFPFPFGYGAPR